MLTEEDIQEVLDKFKKLEQMRATKQKNEGRTGVSALEYRDIFTISRASLKYLMCLILIFFFSIVKSTDDECTDTQGFHGVVEEPEPRCGVGPGQLTEAILPGKLKACIYETNVVLSC